MRDGGFMLDGEALVKRGEGCCGTLGFDSKIFESCSMRLRFKASSSGGGLTKGLVKEAVVAAAAAAAAVAAAKASAAVGVGMSTAGLTSLVSSLFSPMASVLPVPASSTFTSVLISGSGS